jgi:AraC-like DNA-binding protein/mannose-6-phosphate isomerase-like protein (cupin superfamily)
VLEVGTLSTVHAATRDLLNYLNARDGDAFDLAGKVDARRYLGRRFEERLPLLLSHQLYPGYREMVGENWLHWHDYLECFVALSGKGEFSMGAHQFRFGPGDIVVVDPLKLHGVMRMDASHTALVMFFPREFVAPSGAAVDSAFLAAWEQRPANVLPLLRASHKRAPAVHEALLSLARSWFELPPGPLLKLELLHVLWQLREALAAGSWGVSPTGRDMPEREAKLRNALGYIAQHFHRSVSQPEVAKAIGMSTSRFRQFFKETTGWGFARYLIEQRVTAAATLLRESSQTIADIAHLSGFADQSHLLRCFREKYGLSPKAYRKDCGAGS